MSSPAETLPAVQASRQWTQAHGAAILAEYGRMLAIPNHASDLPNITRNAELLAELFAQRGLTTRLLTQTDAPPIVFGERRVASAERTLCFYAHYDGQPVEPALWAQDPLGRMTTAPLATAPPPAAVAVPDARNRRRLTCSRLSIVRMTGSLLLYDVGLWCCGAGSGAGASPVIPR